MMAIICCSVSEVDFHAFTSAFNQAYSDYYVPISMTVPSFRALIERDDLDLEASVAALDGQQIVGTGLLGIRDQLGWIGGMGVLPERRRQGIGRQMMHYLLDQGRKRGLTRIDLEVIEANVGAHALYRDLGFVERQYLLILDRKPGHVANHLPTYTIEEQAPEVLLQYYASFHPSPNCWQRGLRSLQALVSHIDGWAAIKNGEVLGYALGWADDLNVRLLDFATHPEHPSAATALLAHLHRQHPNAYGSSYNIAEDDPVLTAYKALGYHISFRQIEMQLNLV